MSSNKRVKKTVAFDAESVRLIDKKIANTNVYEQKLSRSKVFDSAIKIFYHLISERMEPNNDKVIKRQTIWITAKANSQYNELALRYDYSMTELANLIIKTVYK